MEVSRRTFVLSAAVAGAAFGLDGKLALVTPALAQKTPDPSPNFKKFKVGDATVTAIYDGIWEKPHDPAFIKNASVEDVKGAMAAGGFSTDFVSIPLSVFIIESGGKVIMCDSGSGAGQWQPTAGRLASGMAAAGIDPGKISTIIVSHFHPDHIFGLMQKDNSPVFPNAEIVVNATEYAWWTEPGRVEKLPEARKKLGTRINTVFPTWKNIKQVAADAEVAPGLRFVSMPGHTPGHVAFHLSSGKEQLMISNDTCYVPALNVAHPEWHGAYDQDGAVAEASRRKLMDRVVADGIRICGSHFPFPCVGKIAKDGNSYTLAIEKA